MTMWMRGAALVAQQLVIFVSGWAVLTLVRALTGRTLHGGVDPAGLVDGVAVVCVYTLHVAVTVALNRIVRPAGPPLGILPRRDALLHFAGGLLGAIFVVSAPWTLALLAGRAHVADTLAPHASSVGAASLAFGIGVGLLNSVVEETTSRAFPMRLLEQQSLPLRLVVPALAFAALHWVAEPIELTSFLSRTCSGVTLGLAYAATGNIWLAAGVHTGINYALLFPSGQWHMGAPFLIEGAFEPPALVVDVALLGVAVVCFRRRARETALA